VDAEYDVVWFYLETGDEPGIEVFANKTDEASPLYLYTIDDEELAGIPVDVSVLNIFGIEPSAVNNWLALLEDYENGSWTVSLWEWNGSEMQLIDRYDPPITGVPFNLDCDTENKLIHVWADVDDVTTYYIFEVE